jgi:hypothetical protein
MECDYFIENLCRVVSTVVSSLFGLLGTNENII